MPTNHKRQNAASRSSANELAASPEQPTATTDVSADPSTEARGAKVEARSAKVDAPVDTAPAAPAESTAKADLSAEARSAKAEGQPPAQAATAAAPPPQQRPPHPVPRPRVPGGA